MILSRRKSGSLIGSSEGRALSILLRSLVLLPALGCDAFSSAPFGASESETQVRVVPTDERPAVHAESAPPPVSGGNMIRLASAGSYLVADPLRDEIQLVDGRGVQRITLPRGSRPERATLNTKDGTAHVILRGTGSILALDPKTQTILKEDADVCATPRGIAYDESADRLIVVCAEGQLVFHSAQAQNYTTISSLPIPTDARDVVAQGGRIFVSRFRSAEVLQLTAAGKLVRTVKLPRVKTNSTRVLEPSVAWRMHADPNGDGVILLHQRAVVEPLAIDRPPESTSNGSSPYGGGFAPCNSIVQPAVSRIDASGTVSTSPGLDSAVLAVDFDVMAGRNGLVYGVAAAGFADLDAPQVTTRFVGDESAGFDLAPPKAGAGSVRSDNGSFFFGPQALHLVEVNSVPIADAAPGGAPAANADGVNADSANANTAVPDVGCEVAPTAGTPSTSVVLDDEDNVLFVIPDEGRLLHGSVSGALDAQVILADRVEMDTGHVIFHRDSGSGIACASCHPDGTDDGRVWQFEKLGARRTQHLGVSIADTAPYHWDGSLPTLGSLMSEVFVERMGGIFESPQRLDALSTWLSRDQHPPQVRRDPDAVSRGKVLFESAEIGCAKCHNGPVGTDNHAYDVGTSGGLKLQTPALAGLALHPPFMHTGCASTVRDRFVNPACGGGDKHGTTSRLQAAELDDLVTYLETL